MWGYIFNVGYSEKCFAGRVFTNSCAWLFPILLCSTHSGELAKANALFYSLPKCICTGVACGFAQETKCNLLPGTKFIAACPGHGFWGLERQTRVTWIRTDMRSCHVLCYPTHFFWPQSYETASCWSFRYSKDQNITLFPSIQINIVWCSVGNLQRKWIKTIRN